MVVALTLLLISLGLVLFRDRDFWFPDSQQSTTQPLQTVPEVKEEPATASADIPGGQHKKARARAKRPEVRTEAAVPPATITATRTVLPPLEVEVVAGDAHRTLRPGSSAVHVDLQRASPPDAVRITGERDETAANIPTNAAERATISDEAATIVTESVQPDYPMLARQMKVQGSVILQALIGRDGLIQDLRVLSGPPILATAAREAVRQWHFKPHYQGSQALETKANITVNFTISTN